MIPAASEFFIDVPHHGRLRGLAWEPERPRGRVGLLHGLGDHAARYEHVARELARRGFAAEALDLPGHGRSYGQRGHVGSWEEYRNAVDLWLARWDHLPAGDARALLGHSMGALVVLDAALRAPDPLAALVLSAPPFELVLRPSMLKVRAAQVAARFWPGFSQGSTILPSMLSRDQEVVRAHAQDPLVHYRISARLFFEFQSARGALTRRAADLPVDTLILHGGADPIANVEGSERWARRAPDGRVTCRLYPGLLHEVLNEVERARVLVDLGDWLDQEMPALRV
ncbi:MAG: lysophospholipase [Hyphomicrobiales bacterium]